MAQFRNTLIVTGLLLSAAAPIAQPAHAATYDGRWSVQIASNSPACGNGASVSIGISNGQVASGDASMSARGRVADAGEISVTLSNGIRRATGSGHLAGSSGSGTWHGPLCSGTWTAQRI
jgi:hypothetical protein